MERRGRVEGEPPSVILGVSCDFHDAAAAVIVDGRIVAAAEEERFSRAKHDASLPIGAIASCLAIAGATADAIDAVAFYERPMSVLQRYLAARQRAGPRHLAGFTTSTPQLVGRNLMVGYRIDRALRDLGRSTPAPLAYVDHHQSHAAAAFYPSPFEQAAVVTIDGIGEWATTSIGRGHGRRIDPIEELRYPDSVGLLYSLITAYCGFRPNDDEYKVMGLAPYGTARFADELAELVQLRPDASVAVEGRRVGWFGPRALRRRDLHRLLDGPPRRPDQPLTQREADLAASVQQLIEEAVAGIAARARELTGEDRLCLAGGVALNCVANGRLRAAGTFGDIWVQPAAGDAGSAIGAALALWHETYEQPRTVGEGDAMRGAFLGPRAHPAEVDGWLARSSVVHRRFDAPEDLAAEVAVELAGGAIVGWFTGAMEFGPRSLGHRSILADPRSPTVRQELNLRVKGREGFRPFAPAVLAERSASWFDLEGASPYMLFTAPVAAAHLLPVEVEPEGFAARSEVPRSTIPACTHIDGSARVQTVDAATNPELHRLLRAFEDRTGCPVLVNTSFNRAGEPIVATPDDALRTARAAGLDLLVVEHAVIDLRPGRGDGADRLAGRPVDVS
jgi:carbamoyltransferase